MSGGANSIMKPTAAFIQYHHPAQVECDHGHACIHAYTHVGNVQIVGECIVEPGHGLLLSPSLLPALTCQGSVTVGISTTKRGIVVFTTLDFLQNPSSQAVVISTMMDDRQASLIPSCPHGAGNVQMIWRLLVDWCFTDLWRSHC